MYESRNFVEVHKRDRGEPTLANDNCLRNAVGGRRDFGVTQFLVDNEGKVAGRIALESDVCGNDYHGGSNVVYVVVRSLRKKLGDQAAMIETVHGTGYRLRRS